MLFFGHPASSLPSSGYVGPTALQGNLLSTTQAIRFGWSSPQLWEGACDLGISQPAACRYLATLTDSAISKSPSQNQEDTVRFLWALLRGKQMPFLLDFNLEGDKAGNRVILARRHKRFTLMYAQPPEVEPKDSQEWKALALVYSGPSCFSY